MSSFHPKLYGYLKTSNSSVGFVLPIFRVEGKYFTQRTNQSGDLVIGFDEILDGNVVSLSADFKRVIGVDDPAIYLFIYGVDEILIGSKKSIFKQIIGSSSFDSLPVAVKAQIGRLGEEALGGDHVFSLAEDIKKVQGDDAHVAYINSVIRSASWDFIESNFPSLMDTIRKNEELSAIDFSLSNGGKLTFVNHSREIDIPASIELKTLEYLAPMVKELNGAGAFVTRPEDKIQINDKGVEKPELIIAKRIASISKQEYRVAAALKLLMDTDEELFRKVLSYHKEEARFARDIFALLLRTIDRVGNNTRDKDLYIARLVPTIARDAFWSSRGEMLAALAESLGEYPAINDSIRRLLSKSRSRLILQYKNYILGILDR